MDTPRIHVLDYKCCIHVVTRAEWIHRGYMDRHIVYVKTLAYAIIDLTIP